MPYNNAYNQSIAAQNQNLYRKKIAYQNACDENTRTNDVMSPLEGAALREENVSGGSGTAAATLHDRFLHPAVQLHDLRFERGRDIHEIGHWDAPKEADGP